MAYCEKNNLLYHLQSGFRSSHSCQSAVTTMLDSWLSAINQGELTGAVFLDLRKAFDMVNHTILLKKLSIYNLSINSIKLFQSYLSNRKQKVYLNGLYSSEKYIKHGVPQGSILGPLLFCLYINDMPLEVSNENVDCHLFADDSTLNSSSKQISVINQNLQESLNIVNQWCESNLMSLNPSKTKSMIITSRQRHQRGITPLNLTINNTLIEDVLFPIYINGGSIDLRDSEIHCEFTCDFINVKNGTALIDGNTFFGSLSGALFNHSFNILKKFPSGLITRVSD